MKSFATLHPFASAAYFLAVIFVAMFTSNPVFLACALFGGVAFCATMESAHDFGKNVAFYLPLFLIVAVTNPLFSHHGETPLFFLNGNPVTLEAVLYGVDIAAMLIAVMYWFKCFNAVMTSDKLLFLFGSALPKLSLVLSSALRFVPRFKAQLKKVSDAQKAMGIYSTKGLVDKIGSALRVFGAVVMWATENAVETGDSMRARGYGLKGRSHFAIFRFTSRDAAYLVGVVVAVVFVVVAAVMKTTSYGFYPSLQPIDFSLFSLLAYAFYGALCLLPFLIEIKENIKWKYFVSKI